MGFLFGGLARAGKTKSQTPRQDKREDGPKRKQGRAGKRQQQSRRRRDTALMTGRSNKKVPDERVNLHPNWHRGNREELQRTKRGEVGEVTRRGSTKGGSQRRRGDDRKVCQDLVLAHAVPVCKHRPYNDVLRLPIWSESAYNCDYTSASHERDDAPAGVVVGAPRTVDLGKKKAASADDTRMLRELVFKSSRWDMAKALTRWHWSGPPNQKNPWGSYDRIMRDSVRKAHAGKMLFEIQDTQLFEDLGFPCLAAERTVPASSRSRGYRWSFTRYAYNDDSRRNTGGTNSWRFRRRFITLPHLSFAGAEEFVEPCNGTGLHHGRFRSWCKQDQERVVELPHGYFRAERDAAAD